MCLIVWRGDQYCNHTSLYLHLVNHPWTIFACIYSFTMRPGKRGIWYLTQCSGIFLLALLAHKGFRTCCSILFSGASRTFKNNRCKPPPGETLCLFVKPAKNRDICVSLETANLPFKGSWISASPRISLNCRITYQMISSTWMCRPSPR
jgi:hypothetical protein